MVDSYAEVEELKAREMESVYTLFMGGLYKHYSACKNTYVFAFWFQFYSGFLVCKYSFPVLLV